LRLAGYAFARVIAGEAEILNVAVLPSYRRQGVGRQLLDSILAAVTAGGAVEVFLEVRESNQAARFLYETRGFRAVGVRTDYYRKPRENAVIMRSDLSIVVK
jgi:ribosomal-protein-alanine N-acetyltransferase